MAEERMVCAVGWARGIIMEGRAIGMAGLRTNEGRDIGRDAILIREGVIDVFIDDGRINSSAMVGVVVIIFVVVVVGGAAWRRGGGVRPARSSKLLV
jgi:hypothetical protein